MYSAILQVEFMLLRMYKIDPYSAMSNLTMLDMQGLIQTIEVQNERDKKDKNGDTLSKALLTIRDILNYITMPVR